jgi:hypothetical protein
MASLATPILVAAIAFGPCPETPPSPRSPLSDKGEGPIDISNWPGAADHSGDWLKKMCSDSKSEALCDGYIRGLIDALDFWKIRDSNYFVHRMSYSEIQVGVRDYLDKIPAREAEKYQAPELLLCALNSKFALVE